VTRAGLTDNDNADKNPLNVRRLCGGTKSAGKRKSAAYNT
jgi:hypothetical protein